MNQQERDALREKHRKSDGRNQWWNKSGEESPHCDKCGCGEYYVEWPCDVIKVLDYAEFLLGELKSISAVWDGE